MPETEPTHVEPVHVKTAAEKEAELRDKADIKSDKEAADLKVKADKAAADLAEHNAKVAAEEQARKDKEREKKLEEDRVKEEKQRAEIAKQVKEQEKLDEEESRKILTEMRVALEEYGGESNIPVSHLYWKNADRYRALESKKRK